MWANAKELAEAGRFDDISPELLIKHLPAFQNIRNMYLSKSKPLERFTLRLWQQDLLEKLQGDPDTRKIYWYWEDKGNVGKSWMASFLARNHEALTVSTGKTADIAYMFQPTRIVCFDISRAVDMDHVNFSVMEDIKNGRLMSTKYMSQVKYFDSPHMVVFANCPPPHGKFSQDRLEVVEIGATIPDNRPVRADASYATNFRSAFDAEGIPPPATRSRWDDIPDLDQDILDIINN
jgi:hypothetical protein